MTLQASIPTLALSDASDWEQLGKHLAGREPCRLLYPSLISEEEAFAAASRCGALRVQTGELLQESFVDGHLVSHSSPREGRFFLKPEDRSFAGFLERLRTITSPTARLGATFWSFQSVCTWEVWRRFTGLLGPLVPNHVEPGSLSACLFVGSGLNLDPVFEQQPDHGPALGYLYGSVMGSVSLRLGAQTVVLKPNELLYSPARPDDFGELVGDSALLVFLIHSEPSDAIADRLVRDMLLGRLSRGRESPEWLDRELIRIAECPLDVPEAVQGICEEIRSAVVSDEFRTSVEAKWLCLRSCLGFAAGPDPDRGVSLGEAVRVRKTATLQWISRDEQLLVAANGHAIRFPATSHAVTIVEHLFQGMPLSVIEAAEAATDDDEEGTLDREIIRSLFEAFLRIHAVEPVD